MILVLLSCLSSTPDLSNQDASSEVIVGEQRADAAIQASRAAPNRGGDWKGDWTVSLWSTDIADPFVQSLAHQLSIPTEQWDGRSIQSKAGHLSLIFLRADEIPSQPMRGEVVFILKGVWVSGDH